MSQQDKSISRFDKQQENPNNWANIKDQYLLQPIYGGNGRVLILQDEFKSRYDCSTCGGTGHTNNVCPYCLGTKFKNGKEENGPCNDCTVRAVGWNGREGEITLGKVPCTICNGRGGTLIIPDESKTKTTMGNIIAISKDDIKMVKVKDKVQYTTYTGISYEFMGLNLVICCEKDLLCIVKQIKKSTDQIVEKPMTEEENLVGPRRGL